MNNCLHKFYTILETNVSSLGNNHVADAAVMCIASNVTISMENLTPFCEVLDQSIDVDLHKPGGGGIVQASNFPYFCSWQPAWTDTVRAGLVGFVHI